MGVAVWPMTDLEADDALASAAFLADATEGEASITLKPLPQLRLSQTYLYTRLGTREGVPGVTPGNAMQTANATTLTSRRIMLFPSLTVPARLSASVCRVASKVRCPVPAQFFTMRRGAVQRELEALRAMFCDI